MEISNSLADIGIKKKDSLHIASAIESKSKFFITVDKGILKKENIINEIIIINPINFIQLLEEKR